ncbi:MAG: DUF362 domain-containing protein [Thermodesulfobacteriota bacterium]
MDMTRDKKVITRRDFMKAGACLAAGGLMGIPVLGDSPAGAADPSKVVLVRDTDVLSSTGSIRSEVLQAMLDKALTTLLDTPDAGSAWKRLAGPADVVGIKSNEWHLLPTPAPLESAIRKGLMDAGVKDANISVDDRGVLRNQVFRNATALINVRPMRTHHWSGVGTLLKNYIMFTPRPSDYHDNACENLGALWQLPQLRGKTRMNILVMLTPLFHGAGPHHFSREHLWNYCGLIVSADPVAADATGARIIQQKRNLFFGAPRPISPPILHIAAADTKFGLGNSRPERIHLVKLGSDKDVLI